MLFQKRDHFNRKLHFPTVDIQGICLVFEGVPILGRSKLMKMYGKTLMDFPIFPL